MPIPVTTDALVPVGVYRVEVQSEKTGALPLNPASIALVCDMKLVIQLRIARRADQIALLAPRFGDRDCWLIAEREILGDEPGQKEKYRQREHLCGSGGHSECHAGLGLIESSEAMAVEDIQLRRVDVCDA